MHIAIIIGIIVVVIWLIYWPETFSIAPSKSAIRAAVNDYAAGLTGTAFRVKHGFGLDSLSLAYLLDARAKGELTDAKIDEIMKLGS